MPKRTRRLRKLLRIPKRTQRLRRLPKQRGGEDLWTAASEGNPTNVQTALDEGADVNLLRSGRTPLSIACWNAITQLITVQVYAGYLATINILLDKGANPDIPNTDDKTTILHNMLDIYIDLDPPRAIEIMKLLLEHGANPNLKDKYGQTPLIRAISGNYPIEKATLLMEYGADPTIRTNSGQDAFAVTKEEISIVSIRTKILNVLNTVKAKTNVNTDGDPNKVNAKGLAPLHQLSFSSEPEEALIEKAKVLLEKGANLDLAGGENSETPLMSAIANQKPKLAAFFMDAGANPNAKNKIGSTLLLYACKAGMLEFVQKFQVLGQDIRYANANGATALHFACVHGHPHIMQYLIEQGADMNAETLNGLTPLQWCANSENNKTLKTRLECAELLLKNGANPNIGKALPIIAAASRLINHDFIPLLLKYGSTPNAVSLSGFSVLEGVIVKKGSLETVKTLIEAGANMNHISTQNDAALGISLLKKYRNIDISRYLLEHGADPNIGKIAVIVSNQTKSQPLVLYLFPDLLDLLPLFLEKGQDPNVLGPISATASARPLHLAIMTYNKNSNQTLLKTLLESMKLLVASGADLKLKDSDGRTPEELAQDEETEKALGIIKLWEGFTRSDVAFLNSIFTKETRKNAPKANDYSLCPICLKTVERPEGCMHMQHNCKEQPGFYHKALYEKYKSQDKIHWCTICNRIGFGLGSYFEHYVLGIAKGPIPEKAGPPQLFDKDCSIRSGGGGLPEKYHRFNTLRNVAFQYNHPSFIGQKSHREVMEKLVEAMWNAPLVENPLAELKLAEGSWNRPNTNFLAPKTANASNNSNVPTPNSVQDPIIHPAETEKWQNATFISDTDIIQFQHPGFAHDKEGQQISRKGFAGWLSALLGNPASEAFGHCWQYIPEKDRASASATELANHCGSLLWPREVRVALGLAESPTEGENAEYRKLYEGYRKLYEGYRKQFNRKQRGTQ
jgi:ankyrin repeat protein